MIDFKVPDGYVVIPREQLESLQQDAEAWRRHIRSLWPIGIPMGPAERSGYMPICGCKIGSACGNVACPHRHEVTCN